MTDQDIKSVAEGLSESQKRFVVNGGGDHKTAISEPVLDMWDQITKHSQTHFTVALNPKGKAVRTYLQEQSNG
jgi:hypothetical protein